jgi:small-conductance mechanosensitive channel
MADHAEVEYATATGNDYPEHEGTYAAFIKATVVGTIFVINIVAALAVGGVSDHWLTTLALIVVALAAAGIGLAGSNIPGVIVLLIGLACLYGLS